MHLRQVKMRRPVATLCHLAECRKKRVTMRTERCRESDRNRSSMRTCHNRPRFVDCSAVLSFLLREIIRRFNVPTTTTSDSTFCANSPPSQIQILLKVKRIKSVSNFRWNPRVTERRQSDEIRFKRVGRLHFLNARWIAAD